MEMIADPAHRIARPRQMYEGYTERPYMPLSER
jgi:citrate synthase